MKNEMVDYHKAMDVKARGNCMIGLDRLLSIYVLLQRASHVEGALAELGIFKGGVGRFIARCLPDRKCYLFDTFSGIPCSGEFDHHKIGEWSASRAIVEDVVRGQGNIVLVEGVFPETVSQIPEERFAFVHLDADQYESTRDGLEYFWPRMNAGGVIVLDDYDFQYCPGVTKAVREFTDSMGAVVIYSDNNYITVGHQAHILK